jgi:hypothetical protein
MSKELVVSSTAHETRLAILENDELVEIYFERESQQGLAGSIHKGRVTRVLPGMQSAFVDVGLERDGFSTFPISFRKPKISTPCRCRAGRASRPERRPPPIPLPPPSPLPLPSPQRPRTRKKVDHEAGATAAGAAAVAGAAVPPTDEADSPIPNTPTWIPTPPAPGKKPKAKS